MTNPKGRFGIHGGQYIPETLINAVIELEEAYEHYKNDPEFNRELTELLNEYAGRPSRLYYAKKMTRDLGGAKIYLKREDLNHTGAQKINNVLGQARLAKKMGKTRLIAETGAGQHGVATATAAALMGMECVVFMGEEDTVRQALNVYRMRLLGATVVPVTSGTATLKDAVSEAMREWTSRIADTHYCLGSVMGPHPFPTIVRDFQAVISKEIKEQMLAKEGRLPDAVVACVGGGSNAIGSFYHFIDDRRRLRAGDSPHVPELPYGTDALGEAAAPGRGDGLHQPPGRYLWSPCPREPSRFWKDRGGAGRGHCPGTVLFREELGRTAEVQPPHPAAAGSLGCPVWVQGAAQRYSGARQERLPRREVHLCQPPEPQHH